MEITELWSSTQTWIDANSTWIVALLSATLGSVAGSWWTQRAIEKREHLAAGRIELRAVNRSIMICFAVVNAYMGLKKQHVAELAKEYEECQNSTKAALASGARGSHAISGHDFNTASALTRYTARRDFVQPSSDKRARSCGSKRARWCAATPQKLIGTSGYFDPRIPDWQS